MWEGLQRLSFIFKKPYLYIVLGIIAVVALFHFSGVFNEQPVLPAFSSVTLENAIINMGENTTLTVTIVNNAPSQKLIELRIVYGSAELVFYDQITKTPLDGPEYNGYNYTISYPTTRKMNTDEQWGIPLLIEGLDPGGSSYTYTIYLEIYSDNAFSERKSIQLTVKRP